MLVIDKTSLLNEINEDLNMTSTEMYEAVATAIPLANPVVDIIKLKQALIKHGYTFP